MNQLEHYEGTQDSAPAEVLKDWARTVAAAMHRMRGDWKHVLGTVGLAALLVLGIALPFLVVMVMK